MYKLLGLNKEAIKYINENSTFVRGEYIGCKQSTGVIKLNRSSYELKTLDEGTVIILYKHIIKNNIECYEEIQVIHNNYVLLKLRLPDNTYISWVDEDIQALDAI